MRQLFPDVTRRNKMVKVTPVKTGRETYFGIEQIIKVSFAANKATVHMINGTQFDVMETKQQLIKDLE